MKKKFLFSLLALSLFSVAYWYSGAPLGGLRSSVIDDTPGLSQEIDTYLERFPSLEEKRSILSGKLDQLDIELNKPIIPGESSSREELKAQKEVLLTQTDKIDQLIGEIANDRASLSTSDQSLIAQQINGASSQLNGLIDEYIGLREAYEKNISNPDPLYSDFDFYLQLIRLRHADSIMDAREEALKSAIENQGNGTTETSLNDLILQRDTIGNTIRDLIEQTLEPLDREIVTLTQSIPSESEMEQGEKDFERDVEELDLKIKALEISFATAAKIYLPLKRDYARLYTRRSDLQTILDDNTKKIANLLTVIADNDQKIEANTVTITQKNKNISLKNTEISKKDASRNTTRSRSFLDSLRALSASRPSGSVKKFQTNVAKIETLYNEIIINERSIQTKFVSVLQNHGDVTKVATLRGRRQEVVTNFDNIDKLKREFDAMRSNLPSYKPQRDLLSRLGSYESDISIIVTTNEALLTDIQSLMTLNQAKSIEIDKLIASNKLLIPSSNSYTSKIITPHTTLAQLTRERQTHWSDMLQLSREVWSLETENFSLRMDPKTTKKPLEAENVRIRDNELSKIERDIADMEDPNSVYSRAKKTYDDIRGSLQGLELDKKRLEKNKQDKQNDITQAKTTLATKTSLMEQHMGTLRNLQTAHRSANEAAVARGAESQAASGFTPSASGGGQETQQSGETVKCGENMHMDSAGNCVCNPGFEDARNVRLTQLLPTEVHGPVQSSIRPIGGLVDENGNLLTTSLPPEVIGSEIPGSVCVCPNENITTTIVNGQVTMTECHKNSDNPPGLCGNLLYEDKEIVTDIEHDMPLFSQNFSFDKFRGTCIGAIPQGFKYQAGYKSEVENLGLDTESIQIFNFEWQCVGGSTTSSKPCKAKFLLQDIKASCDKDTKPVLYDAGSSKYFDFVSPNNGLSGGNGGCKNGENIRTPFVTFSSQGNGLTINWVCGYSHDDNFKKSCKIFCPDISDDKNISNNYDINNCIFQD